MFCLLTSLWNWSAWIVPLQAHIAEALVGPNRLARIIRVCIATAWKTAIMHCRSSVGRKV